MRRSSRQQSPLYKRLWTLDTFTAFPDSTRLLFADTLHSVLQPSAATKTTFVRIFSPAFRSHQAVCRSSNTVAAADNYDQELEDIPFPVSDEPNARTHLCYLIATISGKIFGDLTDAFPVPSRASNLYQLVVYDYDSNYIDAEPLKSRSGQTILAGYKRIIERLKKAGLQPRFQRLDNEASQQLKDYLRSENIDFQLAPPGEHKRNIAERCIRTWKNHFIAGLECCDNSFPASLWDYLLPQARITLNLLRGSRINPKLSAYAGLFDLSLVRPCQGISSMPREDASYAAVLLASRAILCSSYQERLLLSFASFAVDSVRLPLV